MSDMEDDGVLVMNFSDDEDNFPAPMLLKSDDNFMNGSAGPNQINETFDQAHSIKLEGHSICLEETKESIFKEFDVSAHDEEYILGAEATAEILAIARITGIENNHPTEVQTQPDIVSIGLDSDSDDDGITSSSDPPILPQDVDNSNKTWDNSDENQLSDEFSSIIISNVESVVNSSENISSRLVEESAADQESLVETNELQLGLPNRYCPKKLFKCKICDFSSKTRFSLSRHKRCHITVDDIRGKEESTSETTIVSRSDVCSLGTGVNSNEKSCIKNNSLCQFNDSIDASFKSNEDSINKVPQLNIYPVNISNEGTNASQYNICSAPASLNVPKTYLFKCISCSFSSKIRFALQRHISLNHADVPKKPEMLTHEEIESLSKCPTSCIYCPFVAKSKVGLINHLRMLHNKIKFECPSRYKVRRNQLMQQHKLTCNKVKKGPGRPRLTASVIAKARKTQLGRPPSTAVAKTKERITQLGRPSSTSVAKAKERITQLGRPSSTAIAKAKERITQLGRPSSTAVAKAKKRKTELGPPASTQLERSASAAIGITKKRKTSDVAFTKINNIKNNLENKAIEKFHNTGGPSVQSSTSNTASRYQCQYCSFSAKFDLSVRRHEYLHTKYNRPIYRCKECKYKSTKCALERHASLHKPLENIPIKKIGGLVRTKSGGNAQDTNITPKNGLYACQSDTLVKHLDPTGVDKEILETCPMQNTQAIVKSVLHEASKKFNKNPSLLESVNGNIRVLKQVKLTPFNIKKKRYSKQLVDSSTVIDSCAEISDCLSIEDKGSTLTRNISEVNLKDLKKDKPQLSNKKSHTVSDLESSSVLYVCEICAYETNNKGTLIFHKLTHTGTTDAKPPRLSLKHETNTDQLPNNILTKPQTQDVFKNITEAEERKRRSILLDNGYRQCSLCKRILANFGGFKKHRCVNLSAFFELVERDGTKFTCKECSFSSDSWLRVKQHLLVHKSFEEAAINKCLLCDFRTKYKSNLGTHMRIVHDKKHSHKNNKYSCDTKMSARKLKEKKEEKAGMGSNENIKYKCDSCDFQTSYKRNLQNHKCLHININELRVYKNKTFNVKINEKSSKTCLYEEKTHNDVPKPEAAKSDAPLNNSAVLFSCSLCSVYSSHNKSALGVHMYHCKGRHKDNMFKCNVCDFKTLKLKNLTVHKYTHDTSTLYRCNYCTYSTFVKRTLYSHRHLKHVKGNWRTKKNTNNDGDSENLMTSTKMKSSIQFSCKHCEYSTKFRFNLKKHIEKLHNIKKVIKHVGLSKGRKLINNSKSLERHVRSQHGANDKVTTVMFKCSACTFTTIYKHSIQRHLKTHVKDNEDNEYNVNPAVSAIFIFKCSFCPYTTRQKWKLDEHLQTHNTENEDDECSVKPALGAMPTFKCSSCPYTTKQKPKLSKHLKTHITENEDDEDDESSVKPALSVKSIFKCSSCFYTSKYKYNLDKHFNTCHVQK